MDELLRAGFAALGLPLDAAALARFQTYYTLLDERSKVMNLTAIHGETDVAQLHFLDSAALLTVEPLAGKSVIDVGTGAGFPGLPLKIAQPDISLTLLDSLDKRVRFLGDVCAATGLTDVTCPARARRGGAGAARAVRRGGLARGRAAVPAVRAVPAVCAHGRGVSRHERAGLRRRARRGAQRHPQARRHV